MTSASSSARVVLLTSAVVLAAVEAVIVTRTIEAVLGVVEAVLVASAVSDIAGYLEAGVCAGLMMTLLRLVTSMSGLTPLSLTVTVFMMTVMAVLVPPSSSLALLHLVISPRHLRFSVNYLKQ